jgi:hypothetical protein
VYRSDVWPVILALWEDTKFVKVTAAVRATGDRGAVH